MNEKEMIHLVQQVDTWAQEHCSWLDKDFARLYSGNEGWAGVLKDKPAAFYRALALAIENRERAGV